MEMVGEAANGQEAIELYREHHPVHVALAAGARGYLLKDMMRSQLLEGIRTVREGRRAIPVAVAARLAEYPPRSELTPRALEVLRMIAMGLSNSEIADRLGRAESTMKVHVRNILEKPQVTDRTEAVTLAIQRGFLHLE